MYSTNWGEPSWSGMASETQDRSTNDRGTQLYPLSLVSSWWKMEILPQTVSPSKHKSQWLKVLSYVCLLWTKSASHTWKWCRLDSEIECKLKSSTVGNTVSNLPLRSDGSPELIIWWRFGGLMGCRSVGISRRCVLCLGRTRLFNQHCWIQCFHTAKKYEGK